MEHYLQHTYIKKNNNCCNPSHTFLSFWQKNFCHIPFSISISIFHHHYACMVVTEYFKSKNPPALTKEKTFNKCLMSSGVGRAAAQTMSQPNLPFQECRFPAGLPSLPQGNTSSASAAALLRGYCVHRWMAQPCVLGCYCWIKLIKHLSHCEEAFPSHYTPDPQGHPPLPPHLCSVWCYSNLFLLWLLAVFSALSI